MTHRHALIGQLWALLDVHGDRDSIDPPETYEGDMMALYAATEVYMVAELAATDAARWRGWVWVSRVLPALVRVVWRAGRIRGRVGYM